MVEQNIFEFLRALRFIHICCLQPCEDLLSSQEASNFATIPLEPLDYGTPEYNASATSKINVANQTPLEAQGKNLLKIKSVVIIAPPKINAPCDLESNSFNEQHSATGVQLSIQSFTSNREVSFKGIL